MIKGTYIFYEDGKEVFRSSNIITKFGKRFITDFIAGNIGNLGKDLAFGIGRTAAAVEDTRLEFEFYRLPVMVTSTDIQTVSNVSTYSVVYKTTIPESVSGVISEVGIYPSTKTSINNYDSKFITDFGNYLDWTTSDGYNPTTSTLNARIGSDMVVMSSNGTSAREYKADVNLDISGYSSLDSLKIAYCKNDSNLQNIIVKLYHTDSDYYSVTLTPAVGGSGTYVLTSDILLGTVFAASTGSVDKTQISKLGITVTPTSGQSTSVKFDGIRINDEDTFDPTFGLISRSVLASPYLIKSAGRQVDVEYKLDLGF